MQIKWESMTCGHCLELLRISIMEEYNSKHNQHEELLTQYNEYDQCNCLGGIAEETWI